MAFRIVPGQQQLWRGIRFFRSRIIEKCITIKGICGREVFETWYKMIAMLQSGLDVRKVITHRMPSEGFAKGFALMKQGSCGKVVLDWG